jgi:anti-anti-sigma factor
MLVLDLARVDSIDAGGLGVLLGLRQWARSGSRMFKLMNVTKTVEEILELTHLQHGFEFCTVRDLLPAAPSSVYAILVSRRAQSSG